MDKNQTSLPYVRGSDTSRAAAESMEHIAPTLRHKVYQAILGRGAHGATDDEVVHVIGLPHRTVTARRRELERMGAVYRTEVRRPTSSGRSAGVYQAVAGADLSRRAGRPPKPPADALSVKLTVYMTEEQDRELCQLARNQRRTKAQMARMCMRAGHEQLGGERLPSADIVAAQNAAEGRG